MLIVNDALNVRRGMMRIGSSAKLLGSCCQEARAGAGGWGVVGLPVVVWGWPGA